MKLSDYKIEFLNWIIKIPDEDESGYVHYIVSTEYDIKINKKEDVINLYLEEVDDDEDCFNVIFQQKSSGHIVMSFEFDVEEKPERYIAHSYISELNKKNQHEKLILLCETEDEIIYAHFKIREVAQND